MIFVFWYFLCYDQVVEEEDEDDLSDDDDDDGIRKVGIFVVSKEEIYKVYKKGIVFSKKKK